eukprot:4836985-Pyramimonas_sp.AAC.1
MDEYLNKLVFQLHLLPHSGGPFRQYWEEGVHYHFILKGVASKLWGPASQQQRDFITAVADVFAEHHQDNIGQDKSVQRQQWAE